MALVGGALAATPGAGPAPPNIVFVIADDMSWEHLGAYGNEEVDTPNIDRLAAEGVVFENAFVSTPSCTPSRAAILTGRNGFELAEGASLWGYLPARFQTYTELLEAAGYRTGLSGKGWAPGFLIDREINPAGRPYNQIRNNPYSHLFEKVGVSDIDYAANFEAFLATTESEAPFCFWVGTFEPHRGYTDGLAAALGKRSDGVTVPPFLPDNETVREDISEYYAEIEHIDRQVGGILDVLKRQGMQEKTIVVFTSDNGMPFPRAKATLYDHGTRVPLIAWWGGNMDGGRRILDPVSLTDIAPTFLELAGAETPASMSGSSLAPLLAASASGRMDSERDAVYLYRERHGFHADSHGVSYPSRAVRTLDFLLIWNPYPDAVPTPDIDGGPAKSFMEEHAGQYPRLHELSFGKRAEFELYDVGKDRYQLTNLADVEAHADVLQRLKTDLFAYLESRRDPRVAGDAESLLYAPYFGLLFEDGLLQWSPEQQGQELSFDERRELLRKAYSMKGEDAFFAEMIRRQQGTL